MKSSVKWFFALLFDQILALVLSALLVGFLGAWKFWAVSAFCSAVSILLALLIPYHESWKAGQHDANALKREGGSASELRGIFVGLFAAIPSFVFALVAFLATVNGWVIADLMEQSLFEIAYRIWFFPYASIFPMLEELPVLYFLPTLSVPVMSGLGYVFGRRKLLLRDYLYYRRESKHQ